MFISSVWQQLFKLADTKLLMSSAYHPQTDDQTERVNQCLEAFLICTIHSCPRQWSKWLPLAEFWYNTAHHSALGRSPFEVLYGHSPRHFGIANMQTCSIPDLEQWLKERELLTKLIQQHLLRAQQHMKAQADKKRSERSFQPRDMVYMKLQPYVQSSLAVRTNKKLSFRFYGPFWVLERIGEVAYKLDLPESSRIHPVLHVSQLKKHIPKDSVVSVYLTTVCIEPTDLIKPECKLGARMIQRGSQMVKQVLVKWNMLPESMATWEDEADIQWET